ncbi:hypothetical protein AUK22_09085 [bacterium CG2_30_54_10]|nr:MAG: hypothetical protein AUK22_09085 [bacterium CG2_30_54_10]
MLELLILGEISHEINFADFQVCLGVMKRKFPEAGIITINANGLLRESNRIEALLEKLFETGVDLATLGNQALARVGARRALERQPRLVRPMNLPPGCPGQGAVELETPEGKIWFVTLFTGTDRFPVDDPIGVFESFCSERGAGAPIFVAFAGPDLAIKKALAWRVSEREPCIHVFGFGLGAATDDLCIRGGRCTVSDVGMVGSEELIDGLPPQVWWNINRLRVRESAASPASALLVDGIRIVLGTGSRAQKAERFRIRHPQ